MDRPSSPLFMPAKIGVDVDTQILEGDLFDFEAQRMEAAEKRRQDEMERRLQQQAAQREVDLSIMRKVVSRSAAAAHLSSLKDRALAHLLDSGVFADSTQLAVDNSFVPSLMTAVVAQIAEAKAGRAVVADVMQMAVADRLKAHGQRLDAERQRLAAIDQAEREERKRKEEERKEEERRRQEELAELEREAMEKCDADASLAQEAGAAEGE